MHKRSDPDPDPGLLDLLPASQQRHVLSNNKNDVRPQAS